MTEMPYCVEQPASIVTITYKSGNPPWLSALWIGKTRIAWWPVTYVPTLTAVEKVYRAWQEKGTALGRDEVRALLTE